MPIIFFRTNLAVSILPRMTRAPCTIMRETAAFCGQWENLNEYLCRLEVSVLVMVRCCVRQV